MEDGAVIRVVMFLILIGSVIPVILMGLIYQLCSKKTQERNERRAAHKASRQRAAAAQPRRRIDACQLRIQRLLGSGQFGDVFFGYYKTKKDSAVEPMEVALKIAKGQDENTTSSTSESSNGLASAYCFFQEVNALDFLTHKNIIQAIGVCTNLRLTDASRTTSALVMEYMDGGSAIDYIRKEHFTLTHTDLLTILSDIAEAGQHLFQKGVVHRDIGARNVLVRTSRKYPIPSTNAPTLIAKLTDFGLAKDVGNGMEAYQSVNRTCVFHIRYTAPEGFTGTFSSQSDVWSWGVLAWELYASIDYMIGLGIPGQAMQSKTTLVAPYSGYDTQEDIFNALRSGYRLKHSKLMPLAIRSLVQSCWSLEPTARPGFDQLTTIVQSAMPKLRGERIRAGLTTVSEGIPQVHNMCDGKVGSDTFAASPIDSALTPAGYSGWK